MNKDEFEGGTRYVGGKVEKKVGDAFDSRDWKVAGVVDQVAGGAQHSYGRARAIAEDAIDSAPDLAAAARDRLKDAGERIADEARRHGREAAKAVQDGGREAARAVQEGSRAAARRVEDTPLLWAAIAAVAGYGLAFAIHGRRG